MNISWKSTLFICKSMMFVLSYIWMLVSLFYLSSKAAQNFYAALIKNETKPYFTLQFLFSLHKE